MKALWHLLGAGLAGSLLSSGVTALVGLCSGVVLARTLLPAARGELATVLLWPMALGIVGELGLGFALSYHVSRDRSLLDPLWTIGLVASIVWGSALALGVGWPLVLSVSLSDPAKMALIGTLATVPLSLATAYESFLLFGTGDLASFNVLRAVPVLLYAAGVGSIALAGNGRVSSYAAAWVAAQVGTFVLATAILVKRHRPRLAWRPALLRPVLGYGARVYASSVTGQMSLRLDQLVMAALGASAALGIYVVSVAVASATMPLFTALAVVVLHRTRGPDLKESGRTVLDHLQLAFLLGMPVSFLLAAATPWLVPSVFGAAYRAAVLPAQVLLVAGVFQGANAVLGNGLRGIGRPGRPALAEAAGGILTVLLLALLLPRYGALGAAIGSLAAYAAVTALQTGFVCRATGHGLADALKPHARRLWPEVVSLVRWKGNTA